MVRDDYIDDNDYGDNNDDDDDDDDDIDDLVVVVVPSWLVGRTLPPPRA